MLRKCEINFANSQISIKVHRLPTPENQHATPSLLIGNFRIYYFLVVIMFLANKLLVQFRAGSGHSVYLSKD